MFVPKLKVWKLTLKYYQLPKNRFFACRNRGGRFIRGCTVLMNEKPKHEVQEIKGFERLL